MNNTITLPNGRVFNLLEDDLTTEDYKSLSGVQVRHVRNLIEESFEDRHSEILENEELLISYY